MREASLRCYSATVMMKCRKIKIVREQRAHTTVRESDVHLPYLWDINETKCLHRTKMMMVIRS